MLKVLTRNLFLGANLMPAYRALAAPGGLATLPGIVAEIFNPGEPPGVVQQTDFAARAIGLADEIEATGPDLIGLQEAAQWRTDDTVAADHLDLLEAELARRGLRYRRANSASSMAPQRCLAARISTRLEFLRHLLQDLDVQRDALA